MHYLQAKADAQGAASSTGAADDEVASTLNLLELVADITQFVTTEILHESSVLFVHSDTADDIKEWVKNGGNFMSLARAGSGSSARSKPWTTAGPFIAT